MNTQTAANSTAATRLQISLNGEGSITESRSILMWRPSQVTSTAARNTDQTIR